MIDRLSSESLLLPAHCIQRAAAPVTLTDVFTAPQDHLHLGENEGFWWYLGWIALIYRCPYLVIVMSSLYYIYLWICFSTQNITYG